MNPNWPRVQRYETITRTIEPYPVRQVSRAELVDVVLATKREREERENAKLEGRRDSDDSESYDANDAQAQMVSRQKDAWKNGRRGDRLGPVAPVRDPLGRPLSGASRATHGSAENAISAASYDPPPKSRSGVNGEGALLGESTNGSEAGFGGGMGMPGDDVDVSDAMANMVNRQKDAWRVPKKARADGAGHEQATLDPDDGGRATMQARQAAAWNKPRRVAPVAR